MSDSTICIIGRLQPRDHLGVIGEGQNDLLQFPFVICRLIDICVVWIEQVKDVSPVERPKLDPLQILFERLLVLVPVIRTPSRGYLLLGSLGITNMVS